MDIARAPSVWTLRYATPTSSISHAGAVRIGCRRAGK
jgi:hypothetical protein